MRQSQKTRKLDYSRRDNVEHEGHDGVPSNFQDELKNQNGVHLFEKILSRNNLKQAYLQVVRNKEAAGVDGMAYDQLLLHLKEHREELLESLQNGTFRPQPVLRVEIPKPYGSKSSN